MEKTNFWNDAAMYGAIMGVVGILFSVASILWTSSLLMLISVMVFVVMLYFFTKRRADLYGGGETGYSYGQVLKYIFCMMIFSGIIQGAWEILARNVFFTELYQQAMEVGFGRLVSLYPPDQMDMMVSFGQKIMFSPLWIVALVILGAIIKGCFFGLFVAAFSKREPNVFSGIDKNE